VLFYNSIKTEQNIFILFYLLLLVATKYESMAIGGAAMWGILLL
jgi:hypothetical protein